MLMRHVFGLAIVAATMATAQAFETRTLPLLAQDRPAFAGSEPSLTGDFWKGRYFGHTDFSLAPSGIGSIVTNRSFSSFGKTFDDKSFVAMRSSSGFLPTLAGPGLARGYQFSSTQLKAGYNLGRFRPYVTANFSSLRADRIGGGAVSLPGTFYNPANTGVNTQSFATIGAGVDFAITNNLSVGVGVSVGATSGTGRPFGMFPR